MLDRAKARALATKSIIHDRESVGIAWTEQCKSAFRKFGCDVLQSKIDVMISSSDQNSKSTRCPCISQDGFGFSLY